MTILLRHSVPVLIVTGVASAVLAQGLPTTQPRLLMIVRETVKVGHAADHVKTEAGWPAALAKAEMTNYYLALVAVTGASEAWFVAPFDSHATMGDVRRREQEDPVLTAELARLSKSDAQHLDAVRVLHAAARTDLSLGTFPDTSKQRFWEITTFRVRPGHEGGFEAAAKAYAAATARSAPGASYRVYEVIAGMPAPTYLVFASLAAYGEFDRMLEEGQTTMNAMTDQERQTLQRFAAEGMFDTETQRFELNPEMSYVPAEVRAQDPAFWGRKSSAAAPATRPSRAPAPKPGQP
jgi:hypothetical protein